MLSDRLIAPVVAHGLKRVGDYDGNDDAVLGASRGVGFDRTSSNDSVGTGHASMQIDAKLPRTMPSISHPTAKAKASIAAIKQAKHRELCRNRQTRYRQRQRNNQRQSQLRMKQLQEDVQSLKAKRQSLRLNIKTKPTPWGIAIEMIQLLSTSFQSPWCVANAEDIMNYTKTQRSVAFLQMACVPALAMGDLHGFSALVEQLRRYSLYFGDPRLQLSQIEQVIPGIMRATASLSLTITKFTLRWVLPHLEKIRTTARWNEMPQSIRDRLLDQRLTCNCSMSFLFDEEGSKVERLETKIDWLSSLIRVLGSVEDASLVFEKARITPECALGELTDHHDNIVQQSE
ncbi:hypothetical protein PHYBOEH_008796 [Phytophthora boehmeriae]|uniref:Bzip transcription factor n=1 Tax=Phytophthora boehmeriae TaxID=109152 RepID=A0A8T1VXG0_9STRA|nr:hypothetical protein PHYBOEH_008796 [Phytophthora boehmeriae]